MYKQKKAVVVGAGIGGLATSILLAQKGFDVSIYEKNGFTGGRCSSITKDGYRFDIGATLLMMPQVYEEIYRLMGKDIHQELELFRMDPIYKIKFHGNNQLLFSSDMAFMQNELERIEKGSFPKFLAYMNESYQSYQLSMQHIINRNFTNALQFYNLKNLLLLKKLKAFRNHYKHTSHYFKNEMLRVVFTFQNIYVGQNPMEASAIFSMLPFIEITDGVWFPKGGMQAISTNLEKIALEHGVQIHLNSTVKALLLENQKVNGIQLKNDASINADLIITNADVPFAYNNLLPHSHEQDRVNKLHYTCSAIMFHWGMNKHFPDFEQHNVYVSKNYKRNIQQVFKEAKIGDDISFYIHSPVKSDKSAAPEGKDAISCIVPISHLNNDETINWDYMKQHAKKLVLKRLKEEGFSDFEENIKFEICYTPRTWESNFNLSKGATFGSLSHNLMQMGYNRPHNRHKKYKNLYFVGGSTHPGNGIPMVLLSSKLTTQRILHDFK